MAPLASLTLFPPHSLDTSILAAVLIGVLLLALLTETFGWVFVGLVVPGYLASIFVINPEAALTVSAEALLTYLLAQLLSRGVSATGAWSEFFGRERFFLIVVCSVLVRAVSEVLLLPRVGAFLDATWGTSFTVDRSLHSIGLVLVPLTANALWKLGLRRGALQVGLPVAATWAILHFLLLPLTNLSFTSLELTYEDVAQRFLASPKAYIILLTTALLAARYNLRYGWDFNGILVAALVALTWLGPLKLLSTVAEVLVLVVATRLLLAAPGVRTFNLEGPRKTVLVFVIGFALKFAVGWVLGGRVPGLKVTDLFGFGYLIPTLLAVKILQKQVTARVLLPTLHTSLAGVLVGSLIGFPLSLLEPKEATAADAPGDAQVISSRLAQSPLGVAALARATCRESDTGEERLRRRRWELRGWTAMWARLDGWLASRDPAELALARELAERLELDLLQLQDDRGREAWALIERRVVGWGAALLYPGGRGPVLEVPRPLSEAPAAEAAVALCARTDCRAVVVSGVDTVWAGISRGDPLQDETTPLRRAHELLAGVPKVLIRADPAMPRGNAALYAPRAVASSLEALWPGADDDSSPPPDAAGFTTDGHSAVLRAHPSELAALVTEGLPAEPAPLTADALVARLFAAPAALHPVAELPAAELAMIEAQVASPLLDHPTEERVRWARAMAALVGLEVLPVEGCGERCWLLTSPAGPGASVLVRAGGAPLVFEVPNPARERGALPAALEFFRATGARALLFSDPSAGPPPGAPHVATPGVVRTTFQALHQAAQRALPEDGLVLQVRGLFGRPGAGTEVLVTLDAPLLDDAHRPAALEELWREGGPLDWLAGRVRYHDGRADLAGLLAPSAQQSYARAFGGAAQATLWLSEGLRGAFVAPRSLEEKLLVSGLATLPLPLVAPSGALLENASGAPARPPSPRLLQRFDALERAARLFVSQQAVQELRALVAASGRGPVTTSVRVLHSPSHGVPFVLFEAREGRTALRGLYFLSDAPRPGAGVHSLQAPDEEAVKAALRSRAAIRLQTALGEVGR